MQNEERKRNGKRMLRILFGCFIGLLLLFTLFSNTLLSLTLPTVAIVESRKGELVHKYQGNGVLKYREELPLTNPMGWKVTKVAVKEGDLVKKGDTLIVYNSKSAEQQIVEEQAGLQKLKLEMEELQDLLVEAIRNGDENSNRSVKRDLQKGEIDMNMMKRNIERLQDDLANNRKLIAPFNGIVTKVNAVEGLSLTTDGIDVMLANGSKELEFEFTAPAKVAANLRAGERLNVYVPSIPGKQVDGVIVEMENSVAGGEEAVASSIPMKRLLVTVNDAEVSSGDNVVIDLTNKVAEKKMLLPNKAIHEDGSGSYIYRVEEKKGPLGNTFYARKVFISVMDSNDHQSAVTDQLFESDKIIIESSQPLQDGSKVRIHF
ncbi:RND family efflux transporter MFP subunit [Paenibacillus castaneae]|uniref:efflux RND transporter periplasmic adaptor subunit n=1 Tax=Paenibacillus castaneae TaxID=474957 RepID=UPI001FBA64B9|nr:efflux RND transporter periplasmic adaptor subunit [Paenibacillus castaneae]NIK75075.1 RND family efflux transporter MFP subunit [Paenibacillus castaneae]